MYNDMRTGDGHKLHHGNLHLDMELFFYHKGGQTLELEHK